MSIKIAVSSDLEIVKTITEKTISDVYPHYYPAGAVVFFLQHHNDSNISADIEKGIVFICTDDKQNAIGTVTVKENEICRLFVLPEYQGRGYGRELLEFAEEMVAKNYDRIILDASLPAKALYLKRGYQITESHVIAAEFGDFLCYDLMIKEAV